MIEPGQRLVCLLVLRKVLQPGPVPEQPLGTPPGLTGPHGTLPSAFPSSLFPSLSFFVVVTSRTFFIFKKIDFIFYFFRAVLGSRQN